MAKSKKIKLTFFGKLVVFLFILLIVYIIYIINNNKTAKVVTIKDNYINLNTSDMIVDTEENDNDIVSKMFIEGMSKSEYLNLLTKSSNYIVSNDNFTNIDYDFENKLHYAKLEEIYKNINNSSIANVEIIGKSVDNRNIYGIEIGKGDKVLFIDANIHAAEVANTLIITKFLSELVNKYESNDEEIVKILNDIKVVCIPCMNPDGYEVYNYGVNSLNDKTLWWYVNKDNYNFENIKSNANGVDLNRNFPTQNAGLYYKNNELIKSVSLEKTCANDKYYGGSELGSEPETKAAMYFMLKHYKNLYAYINMHSQGRVIYAGKPNLNDEFNNITSTFAKYISNINNYDIKGLASEEVGEGNDGSATDFMSELACGFTYSSLTGRLSSDKYIDNTSKLEYSYPVVTIETIDTYTTDVEVFKNEYYNYGIRDMLFKLLEYNN